MRCNICDSVLSSPTYNSQIGTFEPCPTCLDVINSVFDDTPEQLPLPLEEESTEDVDQDEYGDESVGNSDCNDTGNSEGRGYYSGA